MLISRHKKSRQKSTAFSGDPDRIRTCDPQIRNLLLYPAELRDLFVSNAGAKIKMCIRDRLEREAVLGIATLTLGHELGHGFADFHQMPFTGKEESAVDEFSLMTFLDYKEEPKDVRSFYGVIAWFYKMCIRDRP